MQRDARASDPATARPPVAASRAPRDDRAGADVQPGKGSMPGRRRDPARAATRALAARLHAVAIQLLRRVRREDTRMGLSAARASALSVLVFGGPRTIGELAAAEQVSAPTMTRLVAGLMREGYVRRKPDPADGRVVRVSATAKGKRALEAGRQRRIDHVVELLALLEDADVETIAQAVAALEQALAVRDR